MNLLQTHIMLGEQNEAEILSESPSLPVYRESPRNGLNAGKFWEGANLMGIINTIGGTWSQIEQARNGKPVYVQGSNGQTQDIAPMLMARFDQQAKAQRTSTDNLFKMMQLQIQSQQQPKKDNTLLYVGIGVGTLAVLGTIIYLGTKR